MDANMVPLSKVEMILHNIVDNEFKSLPHAVDIYVNVNSQNDKNCLGYFLNNRIEIYVDNFLYLCNFKERMLYKVTQHISQEVFIELLKTTYHECFHALVNMMPSGYISQLDWFIIETEKNIQKMDYDYYIKNHHLFYKEAVADLYGANKTVEFLKENYPDIYLNSKNKLYDTLKDVKKRIIFYDFNHVYQKHYKDQLHEGDSYEFRGIKDIYDMYKDCDERIVYSILTLDLFLEKLCINDLSSEEIEIMEGAIEYAYNKELLKKDYIDNNFVIDDLNKEDATYYEDNVDKLKYFDEINRILKITKKVNILRKTKI